MGRNITKSIRNSGTEFNLVGKADRVKSHLTGSADILWHDDKFDAKGKE